MREVKGRGGNEERGCVLLPPRDYTQAVVAVVPSSRPTPVRPGLGGRRQWSQRLEEDDLGRGGGREEDFEPRR
jgi:hypothetical protein